MDIICQENFAMIRAIFPWETAYFYNDITCLAALPQGSEIIENKTNFTEAGTVTDINIKNKTIDVLCKDGKILRIRTEHYKKYDRPFTKNYLKRELTIGKIL